MFNKKNKLINDLIKENNILVQIIATKLSFIIKTVTNMSKQLEALTAQVEQNKTVTASAVALLQGLKERLDDAIASDDPDALKKLSDELGASTQSLADAITANTPAEEDGEENPAPDNDGTPQE